ncbi:MAG: hypothetical protein R3E62_03790 [Pseudomonadales bacterium]|jgi:hypothetical protein
MSIANNLPRPPMDNKQYFYRTVIFTRRDNQVALADIENPESTTPMEGWLGLVVSLADGQHTIQELVDYMAARYPQVPDNLEATLHSVIERLEGGKILQLSDKAIDLPYYLAHPVEELDLEKARTLIKQDGYNLH